MMKIQELLDLRSSAIAKEEQTNTDKMYLYAAGEYWLAFERSAYQLCARYPDTEVFLLTPPGFPFPVVAAYIHEDDLKSYDAAHIAISKSTDCWGYLVENIDEGAYQGWHKDWVVEFLG